MLCRKLHLLTMCAKYARSSFESLFSLQKQAIMSAEVSRCNIIVETITEEEGNVLPLPPVCFSTRFSCACKRSVLIIVVCESLS